MIYLDNSASTYKKPNCVFNAMKDALTNYSANPGRGGHKLAIKAEEKISGVREVIKEFVNAQKVENVIFTQNCTDALNLAIQGSLKRGGHVIITCNEHNSCIRPIFELNRLGLIDVSIVSPKKDGKITLSDILPYIRKNTYLISTVHISNVDGSVTDVEEIGNYCKKKGIFYLVDAAQSAGHEEIDMYNWGIDLLALAGHKSLFGPQGIGVLVTSDKINLKPIRYGGTGTDSINLYQPSEKPHCYESGTLSGPNILGLGAGIEFVSNNFSAIRRQVSKLSDYFISEIKKFDEVELYTKPENDFGVISFNIKNDFSSNVSEYLNSEFDICTRSGLHCAPLKHKELKTTERGTVRVSFSFYNQIEEIDIFIEAIRKYLNL